MLEIPANYFLLILLYGYGPTAVAPVLGPFKTEEACNLAAKQVILSIDEENSRANVLTKQRIKTWCFRDR